MTIPDLPQRRSTRLQGHDYASNGAYFVTICTYQRLSLFGEIRGEKMRLDMFGRIVRDEWWYTTKVRLGIDTDVFVVMPNHFHGIVWILDAGAAGHDERAHGSAPLHRKPKSLGSIVAGFKASVTRQINEMRGMPGTPVWQRNYYERVIRDENELLRIREYIVDNPRRWAEDEYNPDRTKTTKSS